MKCFVKGENVTNLWFMFKFSLKWLKTHLFSEVYLLYAVILSYATGVVSKISCEEHVIAQIDVKLFHKPLGHTNGASKVSDVFLF